MSRSMSSTVWMRREEEDGSFAEVGLSRSSEWMRANGIDAVGDLVWLNMPEMGAEGEYEVTKIEPSTKDDGVGGLVTGCFRFSRGVICDLRIEGESEVIGVTGLHPIWSEDRQDWIPAGELRVGERLQRADGGAAVLLESRLRSQVERVYNIEVEGDHCYRVGDQGLLVHNTSTPIYGPTKTLTFTNMAGKKVDAVVGTSVTVTLTSANIGGDREDLSTPSWWEDLQDVAGFDIQKGHILASQLGGKEKGVKNLTPLYTRANTPAMNTCETFLRKLVDECEYCAVEVTITVNGYGSNSHAPAEAKPAMPKSITISWKVDDKTKGVFTINNDPTAATQDPCRVKSLPCR